MNENLLFENEKKRIEYPLARLFCFMMFIVWQMGIIYYMGPALNINGRTPLPIDMDNVTMLIVPFKLSLLLLRHLIVKSMTFHFLLYCLGMNKKLSVSY